METGKITVEKMTDAHDCGFAINRTSVEGQMQGSLSMGLGEALFEEVKFDEKGRVLNPNFAEYKIATSLDMPNVEPIIVESHEPYGPFGAKEVGRGSHHADHPRNFKCGLRCNGHSFSGTASDSGAGLHGSQSQTTGKRERDC